jgi:hypothetical protein
MDLRQTAETGATPPLADAEIEQPGRSRSATVDVPAAGTGHLIRPASAASRLPPRPADRRLHRWPIEQALIHPSGTGAPGGARPPGRRSTKVTFVRPGVAAGPLLQTFIPVGVSGPGKPAENASATSLCLASHFWRRAARSHNSTHDIGEPTRCLTPGGSSSPP